MALAASLAAAASAHAHADQARERVLLRDGRVLVLHSDAQRVGLSPEQFERSWRAVPPGPRVARAGGAVQPAQTWCGEVRSTDDVEHARTTLPRIKVVYAYTPGGNRLLQNVTFKGGGPTIRRADVLQRTASWVAGKFDPRGVRFDYGTSCGPEYLDILALELPGNEARYSGYDRAERLRDDLWAARASMGLDRGVWDFLVFADTGMQGGLPYGEAFIDEDNRPDPAVNRNARDSGMAVLWPGGFDGVLAGIGYTAYLATHEVTHMLGAVLPGAPHRTPYAHCTDLYSVMCYDDGVGQQALTETCKVPGFTKGDTTPETPAQFATIPLDCGQDDYFNLALGAFGHWNVNDHPGVCDAASCLTSTLEPDARATGSPGAAQAGSPVRFDASASGDRDGTLVRFDWDVDGDGTIDHSTGAPVLDVVPGRSGTVGGGRVTVVDDDGLADGAPLPAFAVAGRPPEMRLAAQEGRRAGTPVALDASASADPDDGGRIVSYVFTLPDGRRIATGATPRTSWTPDRAGHYEVRVTGTDDEGLTAEAVATLVVLERDGSKPPATGSGAAIATLRSVVRGRTGRIVVRVRCARKKTCRLRLTAGTARRDARVPARSTRTVRLQLPRRMRKRTVTLVLRDRATNRRLSSRKLRPPRR